MYKKAVILSLYIIFISFSAEAKKSSHLIELLDYYGFSGRKQHNLVSALALTGVDLSAVERAPSRVSALEALDKIMQENFARPSTSERQQIKDKFIDPALRTKLLPLLSVFVEEIETGLDVSTKILLGASEKTVRARMDKLIGAIRHRHPTKIVFTLGSQRELWPIHEPIAVDLIAEKVASNKGITFSQAKVEVIQVVSYYMTDDVLRKNDTNEITKIRENIVQYFTKQGIKYPTETDMMNRVISEYKKQFQELAEVEFKPVVDTPKKIEEGKLVRPNTFDTFAAFWEIYGSGEFAIPGEYHDGKLHLAIISNQPYAIYQKQQAELFFNNKPVEIKVVAAMVKDLAKVNISDIFDNFARIISDGKNLVLERLQQKRP